MIAASLRALSQRFEDLPPVWTVIFVIGISLLWLVVVLAVAPLMLHRLRTLRNISDDAPTGITFYEKRRTADEYARDIVQTKGQVSVLWNTGEILLRSGVLPFGKIKRMLLPYPDPEQNAGFVPLVVAADDVGEPAELPSIIASKIVDVTQAADAHKVKVKWWKGLSGNLLTIADEWILVEQFTPFLKPEYRSGWRIMKASYPDAYARIRDAYDAMWESNLSVSPVL